MELWGKEEKIGLKRRSKRVPSVVQSAKPMNFHFLMVFLLMFLIRMNQQVSVPNVIKYASQYMKKSPIHKIPNTKVLPLPPTSKHFDFVKLPGHDFFASKPILWSMVLNLSPHQYPTTTLGWGMSFSDPPSLVVIIIQNLPPFSHVHSECDLPRNTGMFDALLHEDQTLRSAKNQSSEKCSNACVVTSGDIDKEYGNPIFPVGHSVASVISLLTKLESVYIDSGDHGSSMLFLNMKQGLPVTHEWLCFNRGNGRASKGMELGLARVQIRLSGSFSPHKAFAICGTNSLRGYEEGGVGSGRSYVVCSGEVSFPKVGWITRLVPKQGVHLIRHAMYRTMELGGQFVLLDSSPVEHTQREFEGIAKHFENHPQIRLILKYDDAFSDSIYAASVMFIIPSVFEPCGLTQISMRYRAVPTARKTWGLNDCVFYVDDDTIPLQFTFRTPDEQSAGNALERAFNHYTKIVRVGNSLFRGT